MAKPAARQTHRTLLAIALVWMTAGCDADQPGRLSSNQRVAALALVPQAVPGGMVTVDAGLTQLSVTIQQLPVLPVAAQPPKQSAADDGFEYEGWIVGDDPMLPVSTGRFAVVATNNDPVFPRGPVSFTYHRDGSFDVTTGFPTGPATAMPDSVSFGPGTSFVLTIEPQPDPDPGPTPIKLLVLVDPADGSQTDLPDSAASVALLPPVDLGRNSAGTFDRLDGQLVINAVTDEFVIELEGLPFLTRGSADDPGLIYEVWFVDHDPTTVYRSIDRFNANFAGDVGPLFLSLTADDSDGDGIPEALDMDEVLISLEPDGLTAGQEVGQGLDTSGNIFPFTPYRATLTP